MANAPRGTGGDDDESTEKVRSNYRGKKENEGVEITYGECPLVAEVMI